MQENKQPLSVFGKIKAFLKNISWTLIILNVLIIVVVVISAIFITNLRLNSFTQHNIEIEVPKVIDLNGNDAIELLNENKLNFDISDSSYFPDLPPFYVLDQNPRAGKSVKEGRTVYLTVNATTPPMIKVPKVNGISELNAIARLRNIGFDVDENEIVYEPYMYNKAALFVEINGVMVEEGFDYPKGTRVILHVGDGLGSDNTPVPSVLGLTTDEASFVLKERGLKIEILQFDSSIQTEEDSLNAVIFRQTPEPTMNEEEWVEKGSYVGVYLIKEQLFDASIYNQ